MTSQAGSRRRSTYGEVLANSRFRLLFATRTLTITADSLRIMTLSVLIFATTGSPLLGALTFGIGFLPQLAGSLFLGSLADRVRPRRLITAGYAVECVSAAAIALADLPVAAILLLIAVVACLTPVFGGASSRLVAETLTGDAYVLGRSLSSMAASGAQLLGLACGGIAVAVMGPRQALLLSAGCYLVAALTIRVRLPDLPATSPTSGSVLRHSWSGNTELLADRTVRLLLLAQWLPSAFVASAESLIVPFTGGDGTAGLLLACLPAGMLAGNLVVGRFVGPALRERLVPVLVGVLGLPLVAFVLTPPWAVCVVLLFLTGTGFAYGLGLQRAFLEAVPEGRRGQAFGLLTAGLMTLQGVGPVAFGVVAELTRTSAAMALAGLATLIVAAHLWRVSRAGGRGLSEATATGSEGGTDVR